MTRVELEEKMIEFFATSYNKDESEITMDTNIKEDLGGQSILMVGLVSLIENELDVLVPLPTAGACKTVGELTDKVEEQL
jgi:acyl carrier protein